jgi:hypothetical protein
MPSFVLVLVSLLPNTPLRDIGVVDKSLIGATIRSHHDMDRIPTNTAFGSPLVAAYETVNANQ